jgi:CheY-like chemotaxis protein
MPNSTGVLSYTRKDDEFFGGYITSFRKSLELGVHVVTGEESFSLFQDIDGIVIGEQWQKKIAEVIDESTFLIPMLSPLFFNSVPCREEVELFLGHERALRRDDLILPVYFIESPKLEKTEETAKDPIATEIEKRHRYDWRERAKLPLHDPAAREAILELSRAIASALARVEPAKSETAEEVPEVTTAEAHRLGLEAASRAGTVQSTSRREQPSERTILWVDDHPDNNAWERRALQSYGIRFVLATRTEEALKHLGAGHFDAIISDMARRGDDQAGFTLLDLARKAGIHVPFFIYCGRQAPRIRDEAERRGARGVTNDPDELVAMVVAATR